MLWRRQNVDGYVNQDDLDFIDLLLAANDDEPFACPLCTSCTADAEWCQGDVNCDGVVNSTDYQMVYDLLDNNGPFTCLWNAPGCPVTSPAPGCPADD